MSAVTSNANLSDFNVYDTFVEAAEAALGPSEFDNLLFALNCNPNEPIDLTAGNHAMTTQNYMQALNSYQTIIPDADDARSITLGGDTLANAQYFISLFGLTSTNPYRILTFVFAVPSGTSGNYGLAINLVNNSTGTTTFARVIVDNYASSPTDAYTQSFSDATYSRNGVVRKVQVYCSSFTAAAQIVNFRLLQLPTAVVV